MRPKRRMSPASRRSIRLRSVSREILAHRAAQAAARQFEHLALDEIDEVMVDRDLADLVDDDGGVGKRRDRAARGAAASSCRCRETRSAASAECCPERARRSSRRPKLIAAASFHAGCAPASGAIEHAAIDVERSWTGQAAPSARRSRTPAMTQRLHSRNCAIIMPAITRAHTRPAVGRKPDGMAVTAARVSDPDRERGIRRAARRAHGIEAVRRRARGRGCLDRGPARRDRLDHRPERRRQDLAAQHDQRLLSARTAARSRSRASTRPASARPRSPRSGSPAPFRTSRCSAA